MGNHSSRLFLSEHCGRILNGSEPYGIFRLSEMEIPMM